MRFYTEVLGFQLSQSVEGGPPFDVMAEVPELKLHANFLTRDGVTIELLYYERPGAIGPAQRRPMNQLGLTHISFTVKDMDTTTDLIQGFGGHVLSHTKVSTPMGDLMFCTDPDGTRIELWQKPE